MSNEGETMWTRLIDRPPPRNGRYLVFHDGGYDIIFFNIESGVVFKKSLNTDIGSWYWMPLPQAPGMKGEAYGA